MSQTHELTTDFFCQEVDRVLHFLPPDLSTLCIQMAGPDVSLTNVLTPTRYRQSPHYSSIAISGHTRLVSPPITLGETRGGLNSHTHIFYWEKGTCNGFENMLRACDDILKIIMTQNQGKDYKSMLKEIGNNIHIQVECKEPNCLLRKNLYTSAIVELFIYGLVIEPKHTIPAVLLLRIFSVYQGYT